MLYRPTHTDALHAQPPGQLVQASGSGRESEVHVASAPIPKLLRPGRPQAQAGALADRQPHPVGARRKDLETDELTVEAGHRLQICRLQGQLGQARHVAIAARPPELVCDVLRRHVRLLVPDRPCFNTQ
jgi:hypothetical protein